MEDIEKRFTIKNSVNYITNYFL